MVCVKIKININVKLLHLIMNMYGRVGEQFYADMTSALDGTDRAISCRSHFSFAGRAPSTHWIESG